MYRCTLRFMWLKQVFSGPQGSLPVVLLVHPGHSTPRKGTTQEVIPGTREQVAVYQSKVMNIVKTIKGQFVPRYHTVCVIIIVRHTRAA